MRSLNNRKAAIKKLKTLAFTNKSETDSFRKKIETTFATPILPNRVTCSNREFGGVMCDILTPEVYSSKRVILYIHGGSFVGGSRASWRGFCASLANACSSRVIVPEFRLAPAYPFPSAIEDIQSCFRTLYTEEEIAISLDSNNSEDAKPNIIIAADGSGATQALAFLFNLRERYRQSIKHVILLSPWLNLSPNSPMQLEKKAADEVLCGDCFKRSGDIYTYSSNLENPFVTPINVTEIPLKDFPPVFIQIGEKEMLLPDAKAFQAKLQQNGVECTLDIWKDMMFMFQMADEYLQESHLALEKIGKLITARKSDPEDFFADYSTPVKPATRSEI